MKDFRMISFWDQGDDGECGECLSCDAVSDDGTKWKECSVFVPKMSKRDKKKFRVAFRETAFKSLQKELS